MKHINIPEHLSDRYLDAEKAVEKYIKSLELKGKRFYLTDGRYKGRICKVTSTIIEKNWRTKKLELLILVDVERKDGKGYLDTYNNSYLRTYSPISWLGKRAPK